MRLISDILCSDAARLIVAVVLTVGLVLLLLQRIEVPAGYWGVLGVVIGFLFRDVVSGGSAK
jgi:hypothetical protein